MNRLSKGRKVVPLLVKREKMAIGDGNTRYISARMPLHPARTQSGTAANGLDWSRDCRLWLVASLPDFYVRILPRINAKRLREEARSIPLSTLPRYLRIFFSFLFNRDPLISETLNEEKGYPLLLQFEFELFDRTLEEIWNFKIG